MPRSLSVSSSERTPDPRGRRNAPSAQLPPAALPRLPRAHHLGVGAGRGRLRRVGTVVAAPCLGTATLTRACTCLAGGVCTSKEAGALPISCTDLRRERAGKAARTLTYLLVELFSHSSRLLQGAAASVPSSAPSGCAARGSKLHESSGSPSAPSSSLASEQARLSSPTSRRLPVSCAHLPLASDRPRVCPLHSSKSVHRALPCPHPRVCLSRPCRVCLLRQHRSCPLHPCRVCSVR